MADELDVMQARMEFLEDMQQGILVMQATRKAPESAEHCGCGNPIPLTRQQMLPGVRTCVECQTAHEKQLKARGGGLKRYLAGG